MRRHAGANLAGDENGEGLGAVTAGHVILCDVLESGKRRKLDVQLLAKFVASFVYVARSQNPGNNYYSTRTYLPSTSKPEWVEFRWY